MDYKGLRGVRGVVNRRIGGIHEQEVLRADNGECELWGMVLGNEEMGDSVWEPPEVVSEEAKDPFFVNQANTFRHCIQSTGLDADIVPVLKCMV